jgi:Flp pilus assembly protein TadD
MKKNNLAPLLLVASVGTMLIGCNGLGKMVKNADQVTYKVVPNPLELHGEEVSFVIEGKYPAKFFNKKAAVSVTPTLVYNGKEKELKTVNFKGESSPAEGTVINYEKGGDIKYSEKFTYSEEMREAELVLKAVGSVKKKSKEFGQVKIADGTVVTPLLVQKDAKPILGKDKFTKTVPRNIEAKIYFMIQQSNIRPTELKNADMLAFNDYLKAAKDKGYEFKSVSVSAYASPDGEERLNEGLSERRGKETEALVRKTLNSSKLNLGDVKIDVKSTPEDWDGFQKAMQASSIADKDLILRVLSQTSDPVKREQEIKNMAATYNVIADQILPQLRRARININAEEKSRTDAQIKEVLKTKPELLSVEEVLYAATLTENLDEKLSAYRIASRQYPNDWRGFNNAGYVLLLQNKVSEAEAEFLKADKLAEKEPAVKNNLGVIAHLKGEKDKAAELYGKASSETEGKYNMGIINIMNGDYSTAVTNMGDAKTFNAALAKVLNKNNDGALSTLDASNDKDSALGYYLKAVIGARTNNVDLMVNNLKSAIAKDSSLKAKAKTDAEFLNYKSDAKFTAVVN